MFSVQIQFGVKYVGLDPTERRYPTKRQPLFVYRGYRPFLSTVLHLSHQLCKMQIQRKYLRRGFNRKSE